MNSRQRAASRPNTTPAQVAELSAGVSLAQEFPGFLVDEMKPGAGEADDGPVRIGLVIRRGLRKPMLHVHAQPWTFEKDMSAHRREYAELARRVTSVCLRSSGRGKASGRCVQDAVPGLQPQPLMATDADDEGSLGAVLTEKNILRT